MASSNGSRAKSSLRAPPSINCSRAAWRSDGEMASCTSAATRGWRLRRASMRTSVAVAATEVPSASTARVGWSPASNGWSASRRWQKPWIVCRRSRESTAARLWARPARSSPASSDGSGSRSLAGWPPASWPRSSPSRCAISAAAASVKVMATVPSATRAAISEDSTAGAPRRLRRSSSSAAAPAQPGPSSQVASRATSARVFPVPAPASRATGFENSDTARSRAAWSASGRVAPSMPLEPDSGPLNRPPGSLPARRGRAAGRAATRIPLPQLLRTSLPPLARGRLRRLPKLRPPCRGGR